MQQETPVIFTVKYIVSYVGHFLQLNTTPSTLELYVFYTGLILQCSKSDTVNPCSFCEGKISSLQS